MTAVPGDPAAECAAILGRDDPHLHATTLFAPAGARGGLWVVYAFDCELSRATQASREALIPRMRLQWWRDTVDEALAGKPPKAHGVAAPLAGLLRERPHGAVWLHRMIAAREWELEAPFDRARFDDWAGLRFGGLVQAALGLGLQRDPDAAAEALPVQPVAEVLAASFALRTAPAMARDGRATLLPGLSGSDLGALARGTVTETAADCVRQVADPARDALAALRRNRAAWPGAAVPVLLTLTRAGRVLDRVSGAPDRVGDIDDVDLPFEGMRLAWRALTGRW